jgi:hypothetical protein
VEEVTAVRFLTADAPVRAALTSPWTADAPAAPTVRYFAGAVPIGPETGEVGGRLVMPPVEVTFADGRTARIDP